MSQRSSGYKQKQRKPQAKTEADKEQEKLLARQLKYLNALEDLALLRDHYKQEFHRKLENKVKEQKIKLQEQEREKERKRLKEEQTKKSKYKSEKQDIRGQKEDDFSFLKSIKITNVHRMMKIQSALERQGQLKYKADQDVLWNILSDPENLAVIEEHMSNESNVTLKDLKKLVQERTYPAELPLVRVDEVPDAVDSTNLVGKGKVAFQITGHTDIHQDRMENILPRVQPPKFQVLFKDLSTKEGNSDEEKMSRSLELKKAKRLKKQGEVRKMFKHSVAYKTATVRLMKKYGLGSHEPENEVIAIESYSGSNRSPSNSPNHMRMVNASRVPTGTTASHDNQENFKWILTDDKDQRAVSRQESLPKINTRVGEDRLGKALSLQAVEESSVSRVAKGISQLWLNPNS